MPYKIVIWNLRSELSEVHYIHAENSRVAKRKALRFFRPELLIRKIECVRMTELLVKEENGFYED